MPGLTLAPMLATAATSLHMADQELRDKNNRFLGKIKQLSNGTLEACDASNRVKGTYDPKSNETGDSSNRVIRKSQVT